MTFLIIICYFSAVILAGTLCAVATHMLEIVIEGETEGFWPAMAAFFGLIIGLCFLLPLHILGVPVWLAPILVPLATVLFVALFAAFSYGVGYVTVNAARFLAHRSRRAALAIREKLRDYNFHRDLDR